MKRLFCCFVGMLLPVMHEQPMRWIAINPARFDQGLDQSSRIAFPLHPSLDGLVGVFADVAGRCEPAAEVPYGLKQTERDVLRPAEPLFKLRELWMFGNRAQCHECISCSGLRRLSAHGHKDVGQRFAFVRFCLDNERACGGFVEQYRQIAAQLFDHAAQVIAVHADHTLAV